ncbi:MAG: hypothetical protein H6721_07950 [Sandaracinus sp.]|nr:hypothetical protein [Sandaracinus sp.]MCB9632051.1 hypothetical protein [Sandaracinus sp.]
MRQVLGPRVRLLVWGALLLLASPAWAQESPEEPAEEGPSHPGAFPGVSEWAEAFVEATARHWGGRVTPRPEPRPRPESAQFLDGLRVRVHAGEAVPEAKLAEVLALAEATGARLVAEGWPEPLPDGGLGGTNAFDLYLAPTEALGEARSDGPASWSLLDADVAHAVVDPGLGGEELEAAVVDAWVRALTLNLDPAEASSWREATGAWMAWMHLGRFGPADALEAQQSHPDRAWVDDAHGEGGALLLALVSGRHDGGTGTFVRDLWQLTRQRTWEGTDLRASPDLWECLDVTTEHAGLRLFDLVADLSVARFFLGERDAQAVFPDLRGLGPMATPPVTFRASLAQMPVHTRPGAELSPLGSGYALIDVRGAPANSRLRVWLRGEYGVQWSLVALRLDAEGRERGRIAAPPRRGDHRSYVPVELEADTATVLVAVTNLSHRLPDADDPDPNGRAWRLILDLVEEGEEEAEPTAE